MIGGERQSIKQMASLKKPRDWNILTYLPDQTRDFKEDQGDNMKLEPFEMERMQSTWENVVRLNIAESGVHPVTLAELVSDPADREALLKTELGYSQSNGTTVLRSLISSMYDKATVENVVVTNGGAEANLVATWMLTEPGDEAVMMLPNYMQIWGLARGYGAEVKPFHLVEEYNWAPDLDELDRAVSEKTKF
ncbi:MAG: aminotransferase class I/II-fold pyridoxal phosphate-dependent enzyme, partial [Blastocatellia bacterium]